MAKVARDTEIDLIIGQGTIAAETVAAELRRRLAAQLARNPLAPIQQQLVIARNVLEQFEPLLADALTQTQLASWLEGVTEVVGTLPGDVLDQLRRGIQREILTAPEPATIGPPLAPSNLDSVNWPDEPVVRFPKIDKAVEDLAGRNVMLRDEFDQLAGDLKAKAFTVARQSSEETVGKIRDTLADVVREGETRREFSRRIRESLDESEIGAGHLENVFRTNVMSSYAQGQEQLMGSPVVRGVFPFASYTPIHDDRVRPEHRLLEELGLEGTNIYWSDDPVWRYITPPVDFQCRCAKAGLSVRQAAQRGLQLAKDWLATGERPPFESREDIVLSNIEFPRPSGFVSPAYRMYGQTRMAVASSVLQPAVVGGWKLNRKRMAYVVGRG